WWRRRSGRRCRTWWWSAATGPTAATRGTAPRPRRRPPTRPTPVRGDRVAASRRRARGLLMPVEQVRVPRAGESISEATLNRWLKPDGSYVKVDEPLYELGTDKATQEVAAP